MFLAYYGSAARRGRAFKNVTSDRGVSREWLSLTHVAAGRNTPLSLCEPAEANNRAYSNGEGQLPSTTTYQYNYGASSASSASWPCILRSALVASTSVRVWRRSWA